MGAWSRFLDTFFNWEVIERYFPAIMKGVVVTIEIAAAVVVTGTLLGLALAIMRTFRLLAVNALIVVFVDIFRALPPLVLVLLVYFGLPNIGINLPSFAVLWLVLALVLAAFAEEIFWAGILSIPKGQWEAARCTGLGFLGTLAYVVMPQAIRLTVPPLTAVAVAFLLNTSSYYGEIYRAGIESVGSGQWDAARSTGLRAWQALAYVVLPQAVRNVLPDLVSNTVEVVKLTSIASVVALPELLYSADMARSVTFNSSPIVLAAAIYLAALWPIVRLISRLERRIAT